jgi:hypothetical protein
MIELLGLQRRLKRRLKLVATVSAGEGAAVFQLVECPICDAVGCGVAYSRGWCVADHTGSSSMNQCRYSTPSMSVPLIFS